MIDLTNLRKPLSTDQIDFRIQSINKGGYATILAYKDARVDMQRLDEVVGPLNWKREHINSNRNCVVSIWNDKTKQWVSKEDTGTESFTEAEKGLASDSFKRACFNWGIGRELYDYPVISVKLEQKEWQEVNGKPRQTYELRLREWEWHSEFDKEGDLCYLGGRDQNGKIRYEWRNLKLVADLAERFLALLDGEHYEEFVEGWMELEEWEETLLFTVQSKGGWFTQDQRKTIRKILSNKEAA